MKKIVFLIAVFFFGINGFSQEKFEVPKYDKLDTPENYKALEQDVLNAINWISQRPVNELFEKYQETKQFLLKWMMGSPEVHLEVHPEIATFLTTTPELLMWFLGGWTKYSIETKDYNDKIAGTLAGIEMLITFYKKNKAYLSTDKNVEKYIKMKEKGTLKEYISKKLN